MVRIKLTAVVLAFSVVVAGCQQNQPVEQREEECDQGSVNTYLTLTGEEENDTAKRGGGKSGKGSKSGKKWKKKGGDDC